MDRSTVFTHSGAIIWDWVERAICFSMKFAAGHYLISAKTIILNNVKWYSVIFPAKLVSKVLKEQNYKIAWCYHHEFRIIMQNVKGGGPFWTLVLVGLKRSQKPIVNLGSNWNVYDIERFISVKDILIFKFCKKNILAV